MTALARKARIAWRLPWREKLWFGLLFPLSALVLAAIHLLPGRVLVTLYGYPLGNTQLSIPVSEQQRMLAWRIGRITALVARYTPWPSKCLVQALSARALLRVYRIPHVLHLGTLLTGDPGQPMKAHAWLKVGPWIVTGREGHRAYTIVGTFCSLPVYASSADTPDIGTRTLTKTITH